MKTLLGVVFNFPRILCGDTRKKRIMDTTSGDGRETIKKIVEMENEKEMDINFFLRKGASVSDSAAVFVLSIAGVGCVRNLSRSRPERGWCQLSRYR